jgi:hypothetical protein
VPDFSPALQFHSPPIRRQKSPAIHSKKFVQCSQRSIAVCREICALCRIHVQQNRISRLNGRRSLRCGMFAANIAARLRFTASNTDAVTSAVTRVVTRGLVPPCNHRIVHDPNPLQNRIWAGSASWHNVNHEKRRQRDFHHPSKHTGAQDRFLGGIIISSVWSAALWDLRNRKCTWRIALQQNRYRGVNLLVETRGEFVSGPTATRAPSQVKFGRKTFRFISWRILKHVDWPTPKGRPRH